MSFRLKTVLGIAAIEGFLLLVLVWSSSTTLVDTTLEELSKRGETALGMLANASLDPLLESNLATLNEYVTAVVRNEGIIYARILNSEDTVVAEAGDLSYLDKIQEVDSSPATVDDGIYDIRKQLNIGGLKQLSVELGLSTTQLQSTQTASLKRLGLIALVEMLLVALFSLGLGSYLTRQLARLENAARTVAEGELGHQVDESGSDEIAQTIHSFNKMSLQLHDNFKKVTDSEARLLESQQRLDGLVASLFEGVCLVNANQKLLYANPAARRFLKMLGNDSVVDGSPLRFEGLDPEQSLLQESVTAIELDTAGDPPVHKFEISSHMVAAESDEEKEWVLVLRDVTELRRSQAGIMEHERLAAVGQLAAGIAHDFNNILAVIIAASEVTLLSDSLTDEVRKNLGVVLSQGEIAADRVRQILDFSRKFDEELERIDLQEFLTETIELFRPVVPDGVKFELQLDPRGGSVEFNRSKLQQVMANLILNAVDATPEDGEITIRTKRHWIHHTDPIAARLPVGDGVSLSVIDTGVGMTTATKDRIFEPFFTTKPVGKGTGLGLAQVYGLVTQNGGEIQVESTPESGSNFTISFPVCEEDRRDAPQSSVREARTPPVNSDLTLLLVEDQPEVLQAVEWILNSLGYRCLTATDGENALEIFEKHRGQIAAVISDIVMPKLSGDKLVAELRSRGFEQPIILMSGYFPKEGLDLHQFSDSIDGFLQKPIRSSDLKEVLHRCLDDGSWSD